MKKGVLDNLETRLIAEWTELNISFAQTTTRLLSLKATQFGVRSVG